MSRLALQWWPLVALLLAASIHAAGDDLARRAAKARTVQEALVALGVTATEPGKKVLLEAPDLAVKGRKMTVKVNSQIPGTDWIAVLAEPREAPFIEARDFPPGADHSYSVSLDLNKTSTVVAVVRAGGKYYLVKREVKVVVEEKRLHG